MSKRRDMAKGSSADLVSQHGQAPTLIVAQLDATAPQLRLQGAILFAEEVDESFCSCSTQPTSATSRKWNETRQNLSELRPTQFLDTRASDVWARVQIGGRADRLLVDGILHQMSPEFDALYAAGGRPSHSAGAAAAGATPAVVSTPCAASGLLMEQLDYNILFRWLCLSNTRSGVAETNRAVDSDQLIPLDGAVNPNAR